MYESFKIWIDQLPDNKILDLTGELWGEHHFDLSNIPYLKLCFKNSKRVYSHYLTYVIVGD